ncbi:MAG: AAA family ATPase [Massiliimalia sp.]|jgi:predicted kinase
MKDATLHLMVGLPCSGKTTLAIQLEQTENAIRFTPDQWQLLLFGQDFPSKEHDQRHSTIEQIMWQTARRLLEKNVSVILDFGFWGKDERDYFRSQAKELDVHFQMHFLNPSLEELLQRLEIRNAACKSQEGTSSFYIPPEYLRKWYQKMQFPDEDEIAVRW